jgi:hypothetical protein
MHYSSMHNETHSTYMTTNDIFIKADNNTMNDLILPVAVAAIHQFIYVAVTLFLHYMIRDWGRNRRGNRHPTKETAPSNIYHLLLS